MFFVLGLILGASIGTMANFQRLKIKNKELRKLLRQVLWDTSSNVFAKAGRLEQIQNAIRDYFIKENS